MDGSEQNSASVDHLSPAPSRSASTQNSLDDSSQNTRRKRVRRESVKAVHDGVDEDATIVRVKEEPMAVELSVLPANLVSVLPTIIYMKIPELEDSRTRTTVHHVAQ